MADADSQGPLPVEQMTSRQLARRARLIETVMELVAESGTTAIQMRDVTDRSGVALGTVYRYFRSKDHLLAAALTEWQGKVTRRILSAKRDENADALPLVQDFLRRVLQAFDRAPGMAALLMQMAVSTDPDVRKLLDQSGTSYTAAFDHLLAAESGDDVYYIELAIGCVLVDAINRMSNGRITLREALTQVQGVAEILVSARRTSRSRPMRRD
ncbi:TetR/AcrR family transcriptional regulator [Kribbella antibiotica]|uniref:TetR/AcrR family transcriptional regulator n=1 Tax=Kribbella antibiotica TaxID=190195 RepID=A0A4R4YZA5_9ACTN|nr:TetR family transcriptional regulator [Kribbella antibiotica]TDD49984.1 TetR/AcrR family transcriptional regulator [Kribbella antibiotica]